MNLLVKTLLFFISFLTIESLCLARVHRAEFLSHPLFYGTETRTEFEQKLAVDLEKVSVSVKSLGRALHGGLQRLVSSGDLRFDKQVYASYQLAGEFETFVFKDIYLDTDKLAVLSANSAYRLRYRWTRQEKYYRYRLFPFLRVFYPDRCEIQFKQGYKTIEKDKSIAVSETRFELRNESAPFSKDQSAPPPPWLESEFLPVAARGMYEKYPILPMEKLLKVVPREIDVVQLRPKVEVLTERYRTHLNIKNPWGTGPNPDHAFIITIDVVSGAYLGAGGQKITNMSRRLLEVEIEIDRNISTEVDRVSNLSAEEGSLRGAAQNFSLLARKNLVGDLAKIKEMVVALLESEYEMQILPVQNKYSRLIQWFGP